MGLPVGTYQTASASYLDAGNELGNMKIFGKVITAANEVAQAAAWAVVLTAADALSLGVRKRDTYNDKTTYLGTRPTNGAAREVALQARFYDTVNGQEWIDTVVPCLDISLITYLPGTDLVNMSDGAAVEALHDALIAFPVVNPYAQANTISILQMNVVRGQR